MKTRTTLVTLAGFATASGLLAQNVVITRGMKNADEATSLTAQVAIGGAFGVVGEPGNVRFMTQEFSFSGKVVTNAPYSAEEKTESVQTLADGNRITNTTTAKVYRDSQGRTRREMTLPGFGGDASHTLITITDPVSGMSMTLDPQTKSVHEMPGPGMELKMRATVKAQLDEAQAKLKAEAEANSKQMSTYVRRAPAPNMKHEDLGADVIEGVSATGTRETSTIDAGAIGNEKPLTITSERWFSPDLQVEVKSVRSDPRMGTTTHTLTNISRAEPDASLFQAPPDYKVEEGKPGPHFEVRQDVHP